ncbi:MAG: phosphoenolpyruvate--protein phosphotransferase [Chlamydiota bacterium]
MKKEHILKGISLSKGVVWGKPYFLKKDEASHSLQSKKINVEREVSRFRNALGLSRTDLHLLQKSFLQEGSTEVAEILDTHLAMLQDPFMNQVEEKIRSSGNVPAESVFLKVISDYKHKVSANKSAVFQERIVDVTDVSRRILSHLGPFGKVDLKGIAPGSILIAEEMAPSIVAELGTERVLGLISQKGGALSHSAIIAKVQALPYVAKIDIAQIQGVEEVLVDGEKGLVILDPSSQTKERYNQLKKSKEQMHEEWENLSTSEAKTEDGSLVEVWNTVDCVEQCTSLHRYRAKGIGLYRSELLALAQNAFPSEKAQFLFYASLLKKAEGKPVTIRVFDLGGDKQLNGDSRPVAKSSFGNRGLRFLLRERALFTTQMRALLRASRLGSLRILLPMVADAGDLQAVRGHLVTLLKELQEGDRVCFPPLCLGPMIELPSAAILIDSIAKESDFLSIGSNDLVQYTLAVDREDASIDSEYSAYHPSILRLLRRVARVGKEQGKHLLLCGEFAGEQKALPLILGLGIEAISVPVGQVGVIKHMIGRIAMEEAHLLAEQALKQESASQVVSLVERWFRTFPVSEKTSHLL